MRRLARPVFDRIADSLVDAFVARADREHGQAAMAHSYEPTTGA